MITKNIKERAELVKAMNLLARSINNEEYVDSWLMFGVADGDEDYEDYCENDDDFASLMALFLRLMSRARKDGGIYCDYVVGC